MKEIPLTKGFVTFVSDHRYEELSKYKWCVSLMRSGPRAVRNSSMIKGRRGAKISMSRQILDAPPSKVVDHRNHETLDNQDENLRLCTRAQNNANMRKRAGCSSKFKGVHWHKGSKKWCAYIGVSGRLKSLGYFDDEIEAARVYNAAAIEHFKEFALLNAI